MIIIPTDHQLQLAANEPGYVRGEGLHMSDIYRDLYADLEPERYGDAGNDIQRQVYLELGMSAEAVIEREVKRRMTAERPPEQVTPEGIKYSPDLLIHEGDLILGEIKCTWKSSRGAPDDPKFDIWHTQMKAYSYHLGTRFARLFAFFVCGDYTRPIKPKMLTWDIEYSQQELDECWAMLLRHARHKGMLP